MRTAEDMAKAVLARREQTDILVMALLWRTIGRFRRKANQRPVTYRLVPGQRGYPRTVAAMRSMAGRDGDRLCRGNLRPSENGEQAGAQADLLVANDVSAADSGFEVEDNRVICLLPAHLWLCRSPRSEVAERIWERVEML